jgi:hypothetical protein
MDAVHDDPRLRRPRSFEHIRLQPAAADHRPAAPAVFSTAKRF